MKPSENWRGLDILAKIDGVLYPVTVVTHIRNGVWLVDGRALPKRFEIYRGCRRTTITEEQMFTDNSTALDTGGH